MSSLNNTSGYTNLLIHYEKNKDKKWSDWLEFKELFPHPGKQGLVGLFKSKEDPTLVYVFKISQHINYLTYHELIIMNSLNTLSKYCPHFLRSIGNISCDIDPLKNKGQNPFNSDAKYKIEKDILLTEYLDNSSKFCNYIKSQKIDENILYSIVKQVLLAVSIAQKEKNFTHYDLHSNNVMIKRCSRDLVLLYVLDSENQFCIPTRGFYPVIIDFGFSYIKETENQSLYGTLNHTDIGFIPCVYDQITDSKLFLITVADEIDDSRKTKKSKKLKNISKNNFGNLNLDWDSGWDNDTDKCVNDYLIKKISNIIKFSKIFKEYTYYCMDIIQSLIISPLEKQKTDNLELSLITFLKEFVKIENEISNPFYCLYILKGIVESAKTVSIDYENTETRDKAVGFFRLSIIERVDSISKYCIFKDIHYEKMLCSLLCFSRNMEGVLFKAISERVFFKNEAYKKVYIQSPEELTLAIDINIPDDYVFTEKTKILVIDNIQKNSYDLNLSSEEINDINLFDPISRGCELYKILEKRNISN